MWVFEIRDRADYELILKSTGPPNLTIIGAGILHSEFNRTSAIQDACSTHVASIAGIAAENLASIVHHVCVSSVRSVTDFLSAHDEEKVPVCTIICTQQSTSASGICTSTSPHTAPQ